MLRVADFAKSSVKSEEISNDDDGEGDLVEDHKFSSGSESSSLPPHEEKYEDDDDIAERKPNKYRDDGSEKMSPHEFDEKKFISTACLPAGFSVG